MAALAPRAVVIVPLIRMFHLPTAPRRPRDPEDLDPFALADEGQEHREQQERQLDDQAPGQEGERRPADRWPPPGPPRTARRPRRPRGGWPRRRGRTAAGGDLALGRGTVQRARPRQVERVGALTVRAGGRWRRGRSPPVAWPEEGEQRQPDAEGDSTPMSPERPVHRRSPLTPLTAYPASGPSPKRVCLALSAKPWSSATLLSPSGEPDANPLTSMASPMATSSPPAMNRRRLEERTRSARPPRRLGRLGPRTSGAGGRRRRRRGRGGRRGRRRR